MLVPVVSFRMQKYVALKDMQVFDTQGKPVDVEMLPELLGRVPVGLADGNKVDPLHLRHREGRHARIRRAGLAIATRAGEFAAGEVYAADRRRPTSINFRIIGVFAASP